MGRSMLKTRAVDQPGDIGMRAHQVGASSARGALGLEFSKMKSFCLFVTVCLMGCAGSPTQAAVSSTQPDHHVASEESPATSDPGAPGQAASSAEPPKKPCPCQSAVQETTPDGAASGGATSPPPLPSGTKVLHVGDSFAGALGLPLGTLFEQAGVKSVLKHTDASYLTDWAWNGELQKMLWKYNPDLLIITLGANELAIAEPEQRVKTIEKITSLVGDRPCVWVAIPLWQGKHNGLMDVIRKHAAPCVYWDSNQLLDVEHMPRVADGIHPTKEARSDWAKVVFDWLKVHRSTNGERPWSLNL